MASKIKLSKPQHLQASTHSMRHHDSAKSGILKLSPAPVVEVPPKRQLPGFFEDEDIVADIEHANTKPTEESLHDEKKKSAAPADTKVTLPSDPSDSINAARAGHDDIKITAAHKSGNPHTDSQSQKLTTAMKHKHLEKENHKFQESETFLAWQKLKEQFHEAYEKKEGRKMHQAIKQLQDDELHLVEMLTRVHRKKVALMYHLKYLCRAIRKNRTQTHHATILDKNVTELIHQTSAVQQAITKRTGTVALGVRSQLHQMKNILWTKLGMKEYKPPEPEPNLPVQAGHPDAMELMDQKTDMLHVEGKADLARMDQVQTLLDPVNFKRLAQRPGGLENAQKFLLNYLKQCAEVYAWLQNMKISLATEKGVKRLAIKDIKYYPVDAHELFADLERPADPLKMLQEEFPTEKFHRRAHKEFNLVATMFQVEPLSGRHVDEAPPHGVFDKVFKVELPAKVKRVQRDRTLMSFDEFAATRTDMFQYVGPPKLSETDPDDKYDAIQEHLLEHPSSHSRSPDAPIISIEDENGELDPSSGSETAGKKRGSALGPHGSWTESKRSPRKLFKDEAVEKKAKAIAKIIHRAGHPKSAGKIGSARDPKTSSDITEKSIKELIDTIKKVQLASKAVTTELESSSASTPLAPKIEPVNKRNRRPHGLKSK